MAVDPSAYRLRPASAVDVTAIRACVDAAYGPYVERIGRKPGPMLEDYARVVEEHQVTVAEIGRVLAGVLVLAVTDEGFLLENVAVLPEHRGIGKLLLRHAEAEALRQGFGSLYLYTHEMMTENRRLYSKIGYVEFERREERGFARIFMRKILP